MPERDTRSAGLNALKWLVTLGAFAFLLSRQPLAELGDALGAVSPLAVLTAFGLLCCAVAVTGFRWALTMRAYGATHPPPLGTLLYYTWLGLFYNTYVPGAVGGDVVRGVISRRCFDEDGTTRGLAVVFIDRVLGLSSLLSLVSTVVFLVPMPGLELPPYAAALGPLAAAGALLTIAMGRHLGSALPGKPGELFAALPALTHMPSLLFAFGLSVVNHVLASVALHTVLVSVSPLPTLGQSLVVVPVSNAAGFIPLSIAGLGLRDTAFVSLYGLLGVDRAAALASALAYLVCLFAAAGIGGLWQLLRPLASDVREAAERSMRPPAA